MKTFFLNMWRIGRWILLIILALFIALVIYRIPVVGEKERSDQAVAFINAQILSMEDVTGERLPPVPDQELNDSTIEGIDANKNGIRDDVELAIFEMYPDDIKVRAALLQYAMAIQMYLVNVFNSETWKEVETQESRGSFCILKSLPQLSREAATIEDKNRFLAKHDLLTDKVDDLVLNTEDRKEKDKEVLRKFITSTGGSEKSDCDLDSDKLSG